MPDDDRDLERLGHPKCAKCERIMRLVGTEQHDDHPGSSLHTYECECGERDATVVTRM